MPVLKLVCPSPSPETEEPATLRFPARALGEMRARAAEKPMRSWDDSERCVIGSIELARGLESALGRMQAGLDDLRALTEHDAGLVLPRGDDHPPRAA
ncbi:MAG TPA: hypothetical protein VD963_03595 [Phycisphaerales bacterium]|nr:hypothetical protein [Phycisphaerales bacterium]